MLPISQNDAAVCNYIIRLPRLKLAYVEIPKCGSTGLKRLLLTLNNQLPYNTRFGVGYPAWSARFPESVVASWKDVPSDHSWFSVVRSPYTRTASAYRSRWLQRHPDDSFDDFLAALDSGDVFARPCTQLRDQWNNHFRPCSHFVPRDDAGAPIGRVFRIEDQSSDIIDLIYSREPGAKRPDVLPVVHESGGSSGEDVELTAPRRDIIERVFSEDFELGGYTLSASSVRGPAAS